MNAIKLLRTMHADAKVRFKVILGLDDSAAADAAWQALQPVLKLHEELEDEFVYTPLQAEFGTGTPLGDWDIQHDADVAVVEQLVEASNQLTPGTPEWRMCIGEVMDTLSKHVMDEEGQIFGRVEQVWDAARLEQVGEQMQALVDKPAKAQSAASPTTPARRRR